MADINTAILHLSEKGFLDMNIDPELDLFAEIEKLKKEKNAIILAHYSPAFISWQKPPRS